MTEQEKKESKIDDFAGQSSDGKKDDVIAELQDDLAREKDARNEERFVYIVIGVIVLNIHVFPNFTTWSGPVTISLFELLILIPVARRLGIEVIEQWLQKVLERK